MIDLRAVLRLLVRLLRGFVAFMSVVAVAVVGGRGWGVELGGLLR